ncbi:uncharacterized protein LOC113659135 isoform X3 [Tachysurus fulvidraco]|uniref:uncharacterized protein LOC113659135 isoform X3 n=1 Tax=Tachysurus fulvidraco TaxID=1234273 RepID=UPI001FF06D01|nr:uncharacterized protein LOC113659135 isoform X3 [Tachysurus fulvidraco]
MRIQVIFGVLLIYTHVVMGSLFQDHVCRFNQSNQCYVAVGQRLYLQMPLEDGFDLQTTSLIIRYRKTQSSPPTLHLPRWQFVNDNKTMILTSAERNDSRTYTSYIFDVNGTNKSSYTLQVNIEAQVSSVKVSYSCLSSGVMKVNCSADGDNLHFSWTSDFNTLPQLENGTSNVTLEQDHQGNITCHVENHVSHDHDTAELHQCPGSLFQDHFVCRFNQIKPCYVAVGQRLYLQMPWEDEFVLNTTNLILTYRKTQSSPTPTPRLPRWQFVNDNKTMILTSAERNDSGTYTLNIYDGDERSKGSYTLQVNIKAQVSSVKLSYSCLFFKVRKVFCSADGDNLHFSWTSVSITRLEDDNKTLVLDKIHNNNVTCHVENHISREHNSIKLPTCIDLILVILSSVCLILIVLAVLVFCVYKKRQGQRIEAPSQDSMQLVYAEVTHSARNRTDTRPSTSPAQYEGVEYGTVVTSNQKKKEDDVQYGELVFNTPAQKKCKVPKVQEDCVYSEVKRS